MSETPKSSTASSKKRELTSPEFTIDLKKNRVSGSQSEAESDISDLSMAENMEPTGATGDDNGDTSAQITLSDTHLQKLAALMHESFQPQLTEIVQESFRSQATELVKSIVQGVLAGLQTKVDVLETENAVLKNRVDKLEVALESAEQYSRRNCLKISGVPENIENSTDEYICDLARAIDVDIRIQDIDRSHRLGRPSSAADQTGKPRDIVVKFVSYRARAKFYKARVLTKSKGYRGVFINEHLTRSRGALLYEARRRVKSRQLKSAWSMDGAIMVKLNDANPDINFDGTVKRINSESDLPPYVPLPTGQPR